ncbi:Predicted Fe2+/Mn2+ transporter, VIT1/CCC1 family [Arthrobacter alpinus]|uniref:Predicted Fe2+/Mn2+ transporter, VIT1/CCC1 family n=2 Tax=Arthrobacter alpinus TaxID=656366 RepID=A0A1H5JXL7_9MICC|nr:Predicted Fe2+/Mn2+ transporter, VIT1/CCC1 family [Arthrobacter alpinus]
MAPRELPKTVETAQRLNWLRAGVLGANDGIVSVAAVAVGVAGATSETGPILTAGMAALVGGAISMALGEYVSVSSQRDSQKSMIRAKRADLRRAPRANLTELAQVYERKGLSPATAALVANELTEHDALGAHLSAELNLDAEDVVSPWHAAFASAIAFLLGAVLPLVAILLPPVAFRVPVVFVAVMLALGVTGWIGATIGGGSRTRAAARVVLGGALALAATFSIGSLLGSSGLVG